MRAAAARLKIELVELQVASEDEFGAAFDTIAQRGAGGLLVCADPYFNSRRAKLVAMAAERKVQTIYEFREFAAAGGLVSYGTNLVDAYRQIGIYAGRVLKGEKPADLPVLRPTQFELVFNLKAAAALGIEIPANMLARADTVIE